jgi:ABC-type lipoprotein export system ATPase subunit
VHVAPGEVASVVGPNGSGKSTLLKSLTGIVRISSGRVLVGGRDVTGLPPEEVARAGVGYVPQTDDVFAPLTVKENLEMGGYLLRAGEVSARAERVLTTFPALARMLGRRAGRLSGGERKMLAMGRVLMMDPAAFLLDEPTANLAPAIAASLLSEQVRALAAARQGGPVDLRPHLRARRRQPGDARNPGGTVREPAVHRVVPRRAAGPGAARSGRGEVKRRRGLAQVAEQHVDARCPGAAGPHHR